MKLIADTQKIKKNESKYTTLEKSWNYKGREVERKKGTKDLPNHQRIINKMAIVIPYLSIITLNINGLNSPIEKYKEGQIFKKKKNSAYKRPISALKAKIYWTRRDGKR